MRALKDLRETLKEELETIAKKPEMNAGDLETVHKLTDTIKNIDKICIMDMDNEGYSSAGEWEAKGRFGDEYARHDGGSSYARGGQRRDSMGRYSREGGYSRDGRMMGGRYSRADSKEHMIEKLEEMLDETDSERVRMAISKCVKELERE